MAKRRKKAAKKKRAGKSKASRGKGKSRDNLVVASKVKGYVRGKGFIASGDLISAVNDAVYGMLDHATARTEANRRSTIRPQDV